MANPSPKRSWRLRRGRRPAALVATALAALLGMTFAIPHAGAAFKYLKTGMEVPEFSLKTLEGEEFTLASLKGQPATLLVFWATWSPRSEPALEAAQQFAEAYADKGFRVLAVNVNRLSLGLDDKRQIAETREKLKLTIPIVIDAGLATYNAFGVVATPSTAVLDAEGRIVHEAASWLRSTGDDVQASVEVLLGLREPPSEEAVAAAPVYKPDSKALRHFNFGRTMLQRGNPDKAIDYFEKAAETDPTYPAPRVLLGQLLLAKGGAKSVEAAAGHFAAALERDAEDVAALTGHGEALLELDKVDEAGARFNEAVRINPTYTPAVAGLGLVLARQGKGTEAEERFKEALELNPLDAGIYRRRAESFEAGGNLGAAAADYRRAVEILMDLPPTGDEV